MGTWACAKDSCDGSSIVVRAGCGRLGESHGGGNHSSHHGGRGNGADGLAGATATAPSDRVYPGQSATAAARPASQEKTTPPLAGMNMLRRLFVNTEQAVMDFVASRMRKLRRLDGGDWVAHAVARWRERVSGVQARKDRGLL
jgi:hypothetical protein